MGSCAPAESSTGPSTLAQRLRDAAGAMRIDGQGPVNDAFAEAGAVEAPSQTLREGATVPATGRQVPRLSAVVRRGEIVLAVVNGHPMRVGEVRAGWELVSVAEHQATLRSGERVEVVALPVGR